MTTTFPFLKIARDYGISYGEVIRFAEGCWHNPMLHLPRPPDVLNRAPSARLVVAIWEAVRFEQERRGIHA